MSRPDWLTPVVEGSRTITARQLTAFAPPAESTPRRSAVLMLFGEGANGPDIVLTERAHTMRSHPGQVSFPGGSLDPGETVIEAALREAEEETGIDPDAVDILGRLPDLYLPISNHSVTPILGWWGAGRTLSPVSADEVHAVYRAPVSELVDASHRVIVRSPTRDWTTPGVWIGPSKDVLLWGFTAGIIERFFTHIGWANELPEAPEVQVPPHMLAGRERAGERDAPEISPPGNGGSILPPLEGSR